MIDFSFSINQLTFEIIIYFISVVSAIIILAIYYVLDKKRLKEEDNFKKNFINGKYISLYHNRFKGGI
ncbi:MAG: hypothetical protein CMD88_00790 [Gammaproteobacteria bacterium]|nr:hypothetical protein [Gammaproteobacteria bacterium]|tara:strand:+ start:90 stop:293 length:204 start_codon:yes stop_codon:yes gene_type:complete